MSTTWDKHKQKFPGSNETGDRIPPVVLGQDWDTGVHALPVAKLGSFASTVANMEIVPLFFVVCMLIGDC